MGNAAVHNTTSWLAYASWTWEALRRNSEYITYFKSLKNKGLETHLIGENTPLVVASQGFPTAKKAGLLFPVDPDLDAGSGYPMWHPEALKSAVRFHVIDESDIDRRDKPIQLSKFPAQQTHFLDASGTYHIRFLGPNFWFQMQCDGIAELSVNAYIGFENNRVGDYEKRLKTLAQFYGIYDGTIPLDTRMHVPARLASHQKAIIAHDMQAKGASLSTIVSAFFEGDLLVEDTENFKDYTHHAKNALSRAKAYIYGDYLKILDRQ